MTEVPTWLTYGATFFAGIGVWHLAQTIWRAHIDVRVLSAVEPEPEQVPVPVPVAVNGMQSWLGGLHEPELPALPELRPTWGQEITGTYSVIDEWTDEPREVEPPVLPARQRFELPAGPVLAIDAPEKPKARKPARKPRKKADDTVVTDLVEVSS